MDKENPIYKVAELIYGGEPTEDQVRQVAIDMLMATMAIKGLTNSVINSIPGSGPTRGHIYAMAIAMVGLIRTLVEAGMMGEMGDANTPAVLKAVVEHESRTATDVAILIVQEAHEQGVLPLMGYKGGQNQESDDLGGKNDLNNLFKFRKG